MRFLPVEQAFRSVFAYVALAIDPHPPDPHPVALWDIGESSG